MPVPDTSSEGHRVDVNVRDPPEQQVSGTKQGTVGPKSISVVQYCSNGQLQNNIGKFLPSFCPEDEQQDLRHFLPEHHDPSKFLQVEHHDPSRFLSTERHDPSQFLQVERHDPSQFLPMERHDPSQFLQVEFHDPSQFLPMERHDPSQFLPIESHDSSQFINPADLATIL
jgi:hypothetical protein